MGDKPDIQELILENKRLRKALREHIETRAALLSHRQQIDAIFDNSAIYGLMSLAPSEQLIPTENGRA